MTELKVLELFAGIGACSKALERLKIPHKVVDAVEIDKYAVKSFNAVHGTNFEPQDITKWDKDIDVDLIMHGSPCQDFSVAGKQAGGDEGSGTRSSLMYETIRIVTKLKPKYVIWENVKNLLSKKHYHNFAAYIEQMQSLGYTSYYQVLNAKDYGVPQNRERVFTVSIRNDIDTTFQFPEKIPLEKKLKDVLEEEVDEKNFISEAMMNYFMGVNQKPSKFPRKERFLANINRKDQDRANSITTAPGQRPTDNFVVCSDKDIHRVDIPQIVKVRKYDVDTEKLKKVLRENKTYSNGEIATILDQPLTKVEHWFRNDSSFSIPTPEIWMKLKVLLKIDTDEFDKSIMTFEEKEGVYEKANRCYLDSGIAPTLTNTSADEKIVVNKPNLKTALCNKLVREGVVKGGEVINHSYTTSTQRDTLDKYVESRNGIMPTMTTRPDCLGYATLPPNVRIRKLTPKECWRLMGFDDEDVDKASQVNSNAQLYKQAGNSIVVDVVASILSKLLKEGK